MGGTNIYFIEVSFSFILSIPQEFPIIPIDSSCMPRVSTGSCFTFWLSLDISIFGLTAVVAVVSAGGCSSFRGCSVGISGALAGAVGECWPGTFSALTLIVFGSAFVCTCCVPGCCFTLLFSALIGCGFCSAVVCCFAVCGCMADSATEVDDVAWCKPTTTQKKRSKIIQSHSNILKQSLKLSNIYKQFQTSSRYIKINRANSSNIEHLRKGTLDNTGILFAQLSHKESQRPMNLKDPWWLLSHFPTSNSNIKKPSRFLKNP